MHLEVLQYFSCCFAFIQEHREEIFVYFDRSVILALSKLVERTWESHSTVKDFSHSTSLLYIIRKYFMYLPEWENALRRCSNPVYNTTIYKHMLPC